MCRYSGKNYCGTVASVETVGQFYHLSLIITAAARGRNAAAVFLLSTLIELIIAGHFTRIIAFCAVLAFFSPMRANISSNVSESAKKQPPIADIRYH